MWPCVVFSPKVDVGRLLRRWLAWQSPLSLVNSLWPPNLRALGVAKGARWSDCRTDWLCLWCGFSLSECPTQVSVRQYKYKQINKSLSHWGIYRFSSVQFSSVAQSCPTLCDPMNRSTPGLPVHHQLPEFTQTHAHQVGDAIQPSRPLSPPSPAPNPSQHQGIFQ